MWPLPRDLEAALAVNLDSRRWEDLVFDLTKRKEPEAEQLRPPDGGADTITALANGSARVRQAKFHPVGKRINWTDCVNSLDHAVSEHNASEVIFAFPRDLTKNERLTFRRRLQQRHPQVEVMRHGMGDLRDELEKHGDIRKRYLGEGPEDAMAMAERTLGVSKPLFDGPDLLDRAFELASFAASSDADFRYEVTQGGAPLADASYPDSLFIKLEMQRGEDSVRLAALTREGHDPPLPQWWFTDDAGGEQAKREVRRAMARGHELDLHGGYTFRVPQPPTRVKEIWDALPEGAMEEGTGTIHLASGPPIPLKLTLQRGKKKSPHEFTLYRALPEAGSDVAFAGYDDGGVAIVFFSLRLPGPPVVEVSISPLIDFGSSARLNRDAVRFVRQFISAKKVIANGPDFLPDGGMQFTPQHRDLDDFAERLDNWERLFDEIIEVEKGTGVEFSLPEGGISGEEASSVQAAAEILRNRKGAGQFTEAKVSVVPAELHARAQFLLTQPVVQHPLKVAIFGREVCLGSAQFRLPPVQIVPIESLVYLPDGQRLVHLRVISLKPDIEFEIVDTPPEPHPLLVLPDGIRLSTPVTSALRAA